MISGIKKNIRGNFFILLAIISVISCNTSKQGMHKKELLSKYDPAKPFAESHFMNIGGYSVHYRFWNVDTDKIKGKLILIHGLGGSTFSWRKNIPALVDEGYLCVAIDLPAFGFSSREKGYNHSAFNRAETIWTLLDSLDKSMPPKSAQLKWNLVGHSMGGSVIAAMAQEKPTRSLSLVFISGAVDADTMIRSYRGIFNFPPARWLLGSVMKTFFFNYSGIKKLLGSAYGKSPEKEDIAGYLAPFKLKHTARGLFDMVRKSNSSKILRLKNITQPAFLIWGDKDTWIPLKMGEDLNKALPNSQLVKIHGAAHCSMETRPDTVNTAIIHFLNSVNH